MMFKYKKYIIYDEGRYGSELCEYYIGVKWCEEVIAFCS